MADCGCSNFPASLGNVTFEGGLTGTAGQLNWTGGGIATDNGLSVTAGGVRLSTGSNNDLFLDAEYSQENFVRIQRGGNEEWRLGRGIGVDDLVVQRWNGSGWQDTLTLSFATGATTLAGSLSSASGQLDWQGSGGIVTTGGLTVSGGGLTISAGGLSGTAGQLNWTGGGGMVTSGGLTISGGGLSGTDGQLTWSGSGGIATSTGLTVTGGGLSGTAGQLNWSGGGGMATSGGLLVNAGGITFPNGDNANNLILNSSFGNENMIRIQRDGSDDWRIGRANSSDDLAIQRSVSGGWTPVLQLNAANGTITFSGTLSTPSSATALTVDRELLLDDGATDGARLVWHGGSGGTQEYRGRVDSDGSLTFFPGEGQPSSLALTQAGLVGINTIYPAYALDVNGTLHATGMLTGTLLFGSSINNAANQVLVNQDGCHYVS